MFGGITGGLSSLAEVITSGFSGLIDGITSFFTSYLNAYQSGISSIVNFVTDFFNSFSSTLSSLFVPSGDYWENGFPNDLKTAVENKLGFITGFKNAFNVMSNQQGQSLNYQFSWGGRSYDIDFSWYNQYRVSVRELFAVLFTVLAWLRVYKVVSSVFGIWSGETATNALKEG